MRRGTVPEPGQSLCIYRAMAEFGSGPHKRQVIDLLRLHDKARPAVQVMNRLHSAAERDAVRLLIEMCEDLIGGMTVEEVEAKPYRFTLEMMFYADRRYVPQNDPHWTVTSLMFPNSISERKPVTA